MSKKKRSDAQKTKENLLESAKNEFLEYGYHQASLRRICKKANVTTGALYCFYANKEALFQSVLEPFLVELRLLFEEHFSQEIQAISYESSMSDEFIATFISLRDTYPELAKIYVENLDCDYCKDIHHLFMERFNRQTNDILEKAHQMNIDTSSFNEEAVIWFSDVQLNMHYNMLISTQNTEEAIAQMKIYVTFLVKGFLGLITQ